MIPQPLPPEPPKRTYTIWSALLGLFLCCGLPVMIGTTIYRNFTGVKHHIHGPACRRNLQEIGTALAKYSLEHMGRVPSAKWMDDLKPYVSNEDVFYCPAVGDVKKGVYGYAMNEEFVGSLMPRVPSDVPLFFDSTLTGRNAVGSLATLPEPGRHLYQRDGGSEFDRWENNVAFVQGSARATSQRYD